MKNLFLFLLIFTEYSFASDNLLQKIDEFRNPAESYIMDVRIESSSDETAKFKVYLKGNNKTLVKVLAPKKNLGKNMLMLDENMWVFIPNIKRAVRISLNQKLIGEAANGDISRMRWFGDYDYKVEAKNKKEMTLNLTASKKNLTYPKIKVVVGATDLRPLRADFLTLSNKVIKTAYYEDYQKILSKKRPMRIKIVDHLNKEKISSIIIEKMEVKNLPDSLFRENSLE